MLTLMLVDAEIELVPKEIQGHPSVINSARRRGKSASEILLDSSVHHSALEKVVEGERRGRPDIVHLFLLLSLDSILNQEGMLRIIVHTRNDKFIRVKGSTRLPKNYNRFVGLVERLFERGVVPSRDKTLLTLSDGSIEDVLSEIKANMVITFSPKEKIVDLLPYFQELGDQEVVCIVGGFPGGDFRTNVYDFSNDVVSISSKPLKAWTVASEILVCYETALSLREGTS